MVQSGLYGDDSENEIVMKWMSKVILMVCCAALLCGCGNMKLRRQMKDFMGRKVVFPQELMEICAGRTRSVCVSMECPILVLFYGKDECSSCAINHLYDDLSGFEELENVDNCKVMVLFSLTMDEEQVEVPEKIRELKFPFPIYVDAYGDFYRVNAVFPSDKRFHSFLLGADGHPVLIGNPLSNEKLRELFDRIVVGMSNQ